MSGRSERRGDGPVWGLLLAAGAGRRYGSPKALVPYRGRLLVERAAETLRLGGCNHVCVVLGAAAEQVASRAEMGDATLVVNAGWAGGLGSSLRAGLAAVGGTGAEAVVVLLVDTPGIGPEAVRRVLGCTPPGPPLAETLVVATYAGTPGHPVLLGRAHWPAVAEQATGDRGAGPYLRGAPGVRLVPCEDVADGTDIDTPDRGATARGGSGR